jgi:N-acyl-D-amino-acid deacylase
MTVLIKNALIFDGSGKPPFKSDIFINHQRINRLGNFPHQSADKVIDARGLMTTPGFIDVNADVDHYLNLFSDPVQEGLLRKGITTIIGGNTGASLAPLLDGSLISIRKWVDSSPVNVNWHSISEFLNIISRRKLGINFGTLIGHSTVRRAIVGEELRDLTEKEFGVFNYVLEKGLKEGAFGFSTGLSFVHSHNVSYLELERLIKTVAKFKGVYVTQFRNYSAGLAASVKETIAIAKNTGVNTEINSFEPLKGFENDYLEAAALIEKEKTKTYINFDIGSTEARLVEIYTFLPEWARNGSLEVMLENITTGGTRERILDFLSTSKIDDLIIAKVPSFLRFLIGKSLKQLSESQNMNLAETLLRLMGLTKLKAELWQKNIDPQTLRKITISEDAIVASGGMTEFLNLVQKENLMSLEKAVVKATSLPAFKFNIRERGLINEGYFADIVITRDGRPTEVLVNGSIALENGEIKGTLAGKILKHFPKT